MEEQKYGVGVQTFEELRRLDKVYVDKTGYIYNIATRNKYYFLSRPRRFGKSLLLSTLEALFGGRRELFEGLAISRTDWEWEEWPVIHIDLSGKEYNEERHLTDRINEIFSGYESSYGYSVCGMDIDERFRVLIEKMHGKTGRQVVILIDEYDCPLLRAIMKPELHDVYRSKLQAFYSVLKSSDRHIRFAMLTGITKFSKVSVFSGLNNLQDISLNPDYNAICGISESEVDEYLSPGIEAMALRRHLLYDELRSILKERYDGYHFSDELEDIYNPFSLLNVLDSKMLGSYWFSSGSPTFLMELLRRRAYCLSELESERRTEMELSGADLFLTDPVPLFYQAGYLTIKGFDFTTDTYRLGYPNREVKEAFLKFLLPYYANSRTNVGGDLPRMIDAVNGGDPERFMEILSSFFADFPNTQIRERELHYQNICYLVMKLMGYYVRTEYQTSRGRIDMIVKTSRFIYVIEFKLDGTPEQALSQIEERGYCKPFLADGRPIFRIGATYSSQNRDLDSWLIEQ